MKTCSMCNLEKDESEFGKHKFVKDGLRGECKQCRNNSIKIKKDKINPNRKIYRTNPLILGNGVDKIYLNKNNVAIVDQEDYQILIQHIWQIHSTGYAFSQKIRMHRLIMNAKEGEYVDHINGDKLDNRKCNLRICTNAENSQHRTILNKRNKTGKTGVSFDKCRNKWNAKIYVNKKTIHLGRFNDIDSAIDVRKEAEIKYFGEFAPHK